MTQCAYRVYGDPHAEPVVLLHAIATDSQLWAPQLPFWSIAFKVITIDLPGHGQSPEVDGQPSLADYAGHVAAILDELEIVSASLVGLSFGGMVAQAFALRFPDRTRSLVLAHTSAHTKAAVRGIWDGRIQQFEQDGLIAQIPATLERWFTRSFTMASPLTLEWLAEMIQRTTDQGYVAAIRAIQNLDHLDRLPEIMAPTLVLAGEADSAVPPAVAALIADKLPRGRLVVLDNAAHLGNIEQPVLFTEVVGAFLNQWPIGQESEKATMETPV